MYPQISQFGIKIKFCNIAPGKETLNSTKRNCLFQTHIYIWMSLWQDLKALRPLLRPMRWSCFYLLLKALQKHQQPFWSPKVVLLDCRLQQGKENSVLLGETWKLQTSLLPTYYVCAWHSLSSSLALSPAGFPKVTAICSYRGSFGSLGNVPFSLPLWNSDVSLSTTLLHIPTCAAKSQLSVSFLPDSSPGNFPQMSFLGCFWALSLPHPPKTLSQIQYSVAGQCKETVLLLLHSQVLLSERPAKYSKGWWNTHKRYYLHQSLEKGDVLFGLRCDGSPNRNLFQWCLYCYQKSPLYQWVHLIVHLTNTRY